MIDRIIRFCEHDVWVMNVHQLTGLRQFGVKLLRLGLVAAAEFRESFLSIRATSLVYTTLLSMVPFLAVMFSVLKAFGVHQQIEPILSQAFDPLGEKGAEITTNIIQFVDNLKVGVLGAVGVAGLFYTTYSLIEKIEEALNSIWRVEVGRPLARRITDYLSVVLVGPVFVFTAFGLMASSQSHWLVQRVMEIQPFGYLIVAITNLLPFLFMCMLFTFIYKFVPNTPVKISSAFVGGLTEDCVGRLLGWLLLRLWRVQADIVRSIPALRSSFFFSSGSMWDGLLSWPGHRWPITIRTHPRICCICGESIKRPYFENI
jgi:membrane protein